MRRARHHSKSSRKKDTIKSLNCCRNMLSYPSCSVCEFTSKKYVNWIQADTEPTKQNEAANGVQGLRPFGRLSVYLTITIAAWPCGLEAV